MDLYVATYVYNHMYTSHCSSDCLKVLEPSEGTSSAQQTSSSITTAPITTAPITTASQPFSTPVTGMYIATYSVGILPLLHLMVSVSFVKCFVL